MFLVARRERIAAVAVAVLNAAVPAVLDDLDAVAPRGVARGVHRVALAVMVRGIALRALAPDGPATVARHHVNIFFDMIVIS